MNKKIWIVSFLLIVLIGCKTVEEGEQSLDVLEKQVTEPPNLIVKVNDQEIAVVKGSYSWSYVISEDEIVNTTVDALPPYESVNLSNAKIVEADADVQLIFDLEPIDYEVRIWENETVEQSFKQFKFPDGKGGVIFEILAEWEQGKVSYAFALDIH